MRYLLTGGNGWIGTRVAKHLLDQGHDVHFVVREGSNFPYLQNVLDTYPADSFAIFDYDGTPESLRGAVQKVDRVIHLAAYFNGKQTADVAAELVTSNIGFSVQLLAMVAEHSPSAVFLASSSWSAYGPKGTFDPANLYSGTKKVVEDLAVTFPLKKVFLRFSDTYGPGDWRRKIVNIFRDTVRANNTFSFGSPAEQDFYLLHIDDILRAIDHAFTLMDLTPGTPQVAYDLFYEENRITLEEVASRLVERAGQGAYEFPTGNHVNPLPPQMEIMPGFVISKKAHDHVADVMDEV